MLQAIIHQEDMCIAERKTTLAKFMVDVRRSIGSELQLERAMDLAADVLAEAVDSDVGLVHLLRPDRRNPSFQTYSSLSGSRLGVCVLISAGGAACADGTPITGIPALKGTCCQLWL